MLWGGAQGGVEIRQDQDGAVQLVGRFPYQSITILWDGGRTGQARKEQIASRAFSKRISGDDDIHLLIGHDFDRPLASRSAGNLRITEADDALSFSASISAKLRASPYVQDFLGALGAGLIRGLSPGFRVPDEPQSETVRSDAGGLLRTVNRADLFELSAVTVPAYPEAQIEARSWQIDTPPDAQNIGRLGFDPRARWRL
ncbi:MAG: HK97 family phage prohead protease [Pseudomonadota bacterium]